ncbi:hypothetical protein COOONC_23545 [Cooperia oncophora]
MPDATLPTLETEHVFSIVEDEVVGDALKKQQNETEVEYQKLKKVKFHLDTFARLCLRRGLTDALKEIRLILEQGLEFVSAMVEEQCDEPVRTASVRTQEDRS